MGVYDYVALKMICPVCGKENTEGQTKNPNNDIPHFAHRKITDKEVIKCVVVCSKCKTFITIEKQG